MFKIILLFFCIYFSFISELSYREAVENSVNHNTRLCIESRLRMPFLDTQTGIINNNAHVDVLLTFWIENKLDYNGIFRAQFQI